MFEQGGDIIKHISVIGKGPISNALVHAIQLQKDMKFVTSSSHEKIDAYFYVTEESLLIPEHISTQGIPIVTIGGTKKDLSFFLLTRKESDISTSDVINIPNVQNISLLRILFSISNIISMHVTSIEPTDGSEKRGPIDALVPLDPSWLSQLETHFNIDFSGQSVLAQHTRSFLLGINIRLNTPTSKEEIVKLLTNADRILMTPSGLNMNNTALVSEFFRDIGRPVGAFYETVIIGESLKVEAEKVSFWMVSHKLSILLESIDSMRLLLEIENNFNDSRTLTNNTLGVFSKLSPREMGKRVWDYV
ncbi:hypothetical protein [Paenibacillus taichungensis]|uniref:hypothetical protein n=1 Tax=Paenibacillus taichungensis TaxID=484184 RepID=UPI002870E83D|nr:hypothetical protein [Paenibacillus taichungensis]MDR9748548.1 hypothetical protein [Paenibacillus taichungensis]